MQDVHSRGGCVCVGTGSIWEVSVFAAQFCYETKSALKNKVYYLKKIVAAG